MGISELDGEAANDEFGGSISLFEDGYIIAIRSWENDNSDRTNAGCVKNFAFDDLKWNQRGNKINGINANDQSERVFANIFKKMVHH